MSIGSIIEGYMRKHEIRQSDLAKKAGIQRQVLHRWINLDQVPSKKNMELLLSAMSDLPATKKEEMLRRSRKKNRETSIKRKKFGVQQKIRFGLKKMAEMYEAEFHYSDIKRRTSKADIRLSFEKIEEELRKPNYTSGRCSLTLVPKSNLYGDPIRWTVSVKNLQRRVMLGYVPDPVFEICTDGKWHLTEVEPVIQKIATTFKGLSSHLIYQYLLEISEDEMNKWSVRMNSDPIFPIPFELGERIGTFLDKCQLHLEDKKLLSDIQKKKIVVEMQNAKEELYTTAFEVSAKAILSSWLVTHCKEQCSRFPLPS